MVHKIFAIYDQKAYAYLPPFYLPTTGMATRAFEECVNTDKHAFSTNPQDYTLFCFGEFNDSDGQFDIYINPTMLGTGLEFKKVPVNVSQINLDTSVQPGTSG